MGEPDPLTLSQIPAASSIWYVFVGPCVLVSPFFCHATFYTLLHTLSMSLYLVTLGFAFRLFVVVRRVDSGDL